MDTAEKIKLGLIVAAVVAIVYLVKKPGAATDLGEAIGGYFGTLTRRSVHPASPI